MGAEKEEQKDRPMPFRGMELPDYLFEEGDPKEGKLAGEVFGEWFRQLGRDAMEKQLDDILLNLGEIRLRIRGGKLDNDLPEVVHSIRQLTDEYLAKD